MEPKIARNALRGAANGPLSLWCFHVEPCLGLALFCSRQVGLSGRGSTELKNVPKLRTVLCSSTLSKRSADRRCLRVADVCSSPTFTTSHGAKTPPQWRQVRLHNGRRSSSPSPCLLAPTLKALRHPLRRGHLRRVTVFPCARAPPCVRRRRFWRAAVATNRGFATLWPPSEATESGAPATLRW